MNDFARFDVIIFLDGHWDDTVTIKDKKTGQEEILWQVSQGNWRKRCPQNKKFEGRSVHKIRVDDGINATDNNAWDLNVWLS